MDLRHSQITIRRSRIRAFTLTELLVVIGLIVVLISLAVPTFSALRGSNSIENATNVVSASLARARAEAVSLQRPFGIAFYREAASARFAMALVEIKTPANWTTGITYAVGDWVKNGSPGNYDYYVVARNHSATTIATDVGNGSLRAVHASTNALIDAGNPAIDLVVGSDRLLLPTGVACAVAVEPYPPQGLILFDENGTLTTRAFVVAQESELYQQIAPNAAGAITTPLPTSQIGLMLFEDETAKNAPDPNVYIRDSGTPLLVNRYNGTIVKGE